MSAHVPLDELLADIDKVVEDYKTLGCRYIAVPWLDEARRRDSPVTRRFSRISAPSGRPAPPRA